MTPCTNDELCPVCREIMATNLVDALASFLETDRILDMNTPLTSSLADAKKVQALVLGFAPKAVVVYDPNAPVPPDAQTSNGILDERISGGAPLIPVAADTPDDSVGTFALYTGDIKQPLLVIPPQAFDSDYSYTLNGKRTAVAIYNVGSLLAARHTKEHNYGIRLGDNLVAGGPDLDKDDVAQPDRQCLLYWSSKPYNERQEPNYVAQ